MAASAITCRNCGHDEQRCRDCQTFEFDHAPARNVGVHFTALTGASVVTPQNLAAAMAALRPDYAICLADETAANTSKRRAENAAKRTARWTAELVDELVSLRPDGAPAAGVDGPPSPKRARGDDAAAGHTGATAVPVDAASALLPGTALVGAIAGHAIPHRGRSVATEVTRHDHHFSGAHPACLLLSPTRTDAHQHSQIRLDRGSPLLDKHPTCSPRSLSNSVCLLLRRHPRRRRQNGGRHRMHCMSCDHRLPWAARQRLVVRCRVLHSWPGPRGDRRRVAGHRGDGPAGPACGQAVVCLRCNHAGRHPRPGQARL